MRSSLLIATTLLLGAHAAPPPLDPRADAVAIPAGIVLLGEDGANGAGAPTRVAAFRIDRHEVTNRQFAAFVAATGHVTQAEREGHAPVFVMPKQTVSLDDPSQWWQMIKGADWRHPNGPDSSIAGHPDNPVVQVTYEDATAYATWAGGALPDLAHWERAARGRQTDAQAVSHWLRDAKGRPLANTWQGVFPVVNTAEDGFVGVAQVQSFAPNDFGIYDMVGNVWEWTTAPASGERRIIKGGSHLCAQNYCANYRPAAWQAQEHDLGASHIGFRVIWPASPHGTTGDPRPPL